MKAAIYYGPGDIRLKEIETPKAKDGIEGLGMVMKVGACGVCPMVDVTAWKRTSLTKGTGIALGHEYCGDVVEVGPKVTAVKVGDRVYGLSFPPCNKCKACQARDWARCTGFTDGTAGSWTNGGFAEYLFFPFVTKENIIVYPKTMSCRDGALMEPLMLSIGLANKAKPGDVVVVQGQDLTGLGVVAQLKSTGIAKKIIASDVSKKRLEASKEVGADVVVDELNQDVVEVVMDETSGEGAEVVIEGGGRPETFQQAIDMVRRRGTIWLAGGYDAPFMFNPSLERPATPKRPHLPMSSLARKGGISIHCSWGTLGPKEPREQEVLNLIQSGRITANKYVTHVFPLEKTREAIVTAMNSPDAIKVMVEP